MPARPLRRFEPTLLAVGFALATHAGCSSDSASTTGVSHPTLIEIAPEQFVGEVPCAASGTEPGLKRYVATLFDMGGSDGDGGAGSDDDASGGETSATGFALPSSEPLSCLAGVGFGFIVPGRRYSARIAGFDRDDITSRAPGSALVVDADGAGVAPTWTAECDATLAVEQTIVRVKRCSRFEPSDEAAVGSVHVRSAPLLGSVECGTAPGQVDHLTVSLDVDGEPLVQTIGCADEAAVFEGLAPYRQVRASVEAFSAGSTEAFAGSSCAARTLPQAAVVAQCTALREEGTLRVDLPAALSLLGLRCGDVTALGVSALGSGQASPFSPQPCDETVDQGFPAGAASLSLSVTQGDEVSELTCFGRVVPGRVVVAECELD